MPASPADSAIYASLLGDRETAALFTDTAESRAMLLVFGALAKVQGDLGVIPQTAAAYINRAAREVQIDPSALAASVASNGVPVPALIEAFRTAAEAPEHMAFVHWGATSQDIMDTGLALRLRRVVEIWDARLADAITVLGHLAATHADLPLAGRSYGQAATPTSFGAIVASWGAPLIRHRARLHAVKADILHVSLSGAIGTLSAMGPQGAEVRAGLARELGLGDPQASWHSQRDGLVAFSAWMAGVCTSLGKMGADIILHMQSGLNEITLVGAGGSSTMPHKQNPVGPSVLVALASSTAALAQTMTGAGLHRGQRDGAAWFTEWLTLPQLCISTGRALGLCGDVARALSPNPAAMARGLDAEGGLIYAEALTFALTQQMPRPQAAEAVKALSARVRAGEGDLQSLAAQLWPSLDFAALRATAMGEAPATARAFAQSAAAV